MNTTDCLLVHVPKFRNYYPPLNSYSNIHWMSQSILGLADAVNKRSLTCRVIHLGIERVLDPRFDLGVFVKEHGVKTVGFSMHWHQQITDVILQAQSVKDKNPETFVYAGGMSASIFSTELLQSYDVFDAIITGEAEKTVVDLVDQVAQQNTDLSSIANLHWRKGREIISNPVTYQASKKELDEIDYCKLDYLEHYQDYIGFPKAILNTRLPNSLNFKLSKRLNKSKHPVFHGLVTGRGCYVNCFYCGGGNKAQKQVNNRHGVIFRSTDAVIRDIKHLIRFGYVGSYISFDPRPKSLPYYHELFEKIRWKKLPFGIIFSCWDLPTKEFVIDFHNTFADSPVAMISVSPETGSEKLRKKARGRFYSNSELLTVLDTCETHKVSTTVFFSLGVPGEEKEDFQETLNLKKEIDSRYSVVETTAFVIEMEPAAPWYVNPDQFGITSLRTNLKDFIIQQNDPKYSPMSTTGYTKNELFGEPVKNSKDLEKKLLQLKCNHFCDQKAMCMILRSAWKVSNTLGLTTLSDRRHQAPEFYDKSWRGKFDQDQ